MDNESQLAGMKRRVRESARGAHPKGDTLHDAADLVDRKASDATEGPWVAKQDTLFAANREKWEVAREVFPEDLAWMALVGPDIGGLLAKALRHEAQAQHNGIAANPHLTVIAEVFTAGLDHKEPEVVPLPEIPVTKRMTREEMLAEHELSPQASTSATSQAHEYGFMLTKPEDGKGLVNCACGWDYEGMEMTESDAEIRYARHIEETPSGPVVTGQCPICGGH